MSPWDVILSEAASLLMPVILSEGARPSRKTPAQPETPQPPKGVSTASGFPKSNLRARSLPANTRASSVFPVPLWLIEVGARLDFGHPPGGESRPAWGG